MCFACWRYILLIFGVCFTLRTTQSNCYTIFSVSLVHRTLTQVVKFSKARCIRVKYFRIEIDITSTAASIGRGKPSITIILSASRPIQRLLIRVAKTLHSGWAICGVLEKHIRWMTAIMGRGGSFVLFSITALPCLNLCSSRSPHTTTGEDDKNVH